MMYKWVESIGTAMSISRQGIERGMINSRGEGNVFREGKIAKIH